jgi:CheY-like chemotaxis protein
MPDTIICDASMPRMDGFQLRVALKADERYQLFPMHQERRLATSERLFEPGMYKRRNML